MSRTPEGEKVQQAIVEMSIIVERMIQETVASYATAFSDNPVIPYTALMHAISDRLGALVAIFPEETHDRMIKLIVERILESHHSESSKDKPYVHKGFGHA